MMNFGEALISMRNGFAVFRAAWQEVPVLAIRQPEAHSKMNEPYMYLTSQNGDVYPWVPTHEDLLAHDWQTTKMRVNEPYGSAS